MWAQRPRARLAAGPAAVGLSAVGLAAERQPGRRRDRPAAGAADHLRGRPVAGHVLPADVRPAQRLDPTDLAMSALLAAEPTEPAPAQRAAADWQKRAVAAGHGGALRPAAGSGPAQPHSVASRPAHREADHDAAGPRPEAVWRHPAQPRSAVSHRGGGHDAAEPPRRAVPADGLEQRRAAAQPDALPARPRAAPGASEPAEAAGARRAWARAPGRQPAEEEAAAAQPSAWRAAAGAAEQRGAERQPVEVAAGAERPWAALAQGAGRAAALPSSFPRTGPALGRPAPPARAASARTRFRPPRDDRSATRASAPWSRAVQHSTSSSTDPQWSRRMSRDAVER